MSGGYPIPLTLPTTWLPPEWEGNNLAATTANAARAAQAAKAAIQTAYSAASKGSGSQYGVWFQIPMFDGKPIVLDQMPILLVAEGNAFPAWAQGQDMFSGRAIMQPDGTMNFPSNTPRPDWIQWYITFIPTKDSLGQIATFTAAPGETQIADGGGAAPPPVDPPPDTPPDPPSGSESDDPDDGGNDNDGP